MEDTNISKNQKEVIFFDPQGNGWGSQGIEDIIEDKQPGVEETETTTVDNDLNKGGAGDNNEASDGQDTKREDIEKVIGADGISEPIDDGQQTDEGDDESEDDIEEDGVGDDVGDSEEIFESDDFFLVSAERLKKQGILPDDLELSEDMSDDDKDLAIYNGYKEKLKVDVNKELFKEFQDEISKLGWNQDTLEYAALLQNGVSPEQISNIVDYDSLASTNIGELSFDDKVELSRKMYLDREWDPKEIDRVLDDIVTNELEGEIDSISEKAINYFSEKRDAYKAQAAQIAEQEKRARDQILIQRQQIIDGVLSKGVIMDDQLSEDQVDELDDAFYKNDVTIQHNGQVYNVTKWDEFNQKLMSDFELQLWLFKKYLFKDSEYADIKSQMENNIGSTTSSKWRKTNNKSGGGKKTTNKNKNALQDLGKNIFVYDPEKIG